MGPDYRPDLQRDHGVAHGLSPFAQAQGAAPSLWSAHSAPAFFANPTPTLAPAPVPAAAAQAQTPGLLSSLWDGAKGLGSKGYHGLTDWAFEGRDRNNGRAPTQAEIDQDPSWRLMGPKETFYHDNNRGAAERKYVRDDPNSFLGLGGTEAVIDGDTGRPMEAGPYQATYNYVNPAKGGMGDLSLGGIGRNLGHLALDVIPYWFGGTVRGDEGTNFAQRVLGPETYKKAGAAWDGATNWVGDKASGIGHAVGDAWDGTKNWVGNKASSVGHAAGDAWDGAKNWAGNKASSIGKGISAGWRGLTGWMGG